MCLCDLSKTLNLQSPPLLSQDGIPLWSDIHLFCNKPCDKLYSGIQISRIRLSFTQITVYNDELLRRPQGKGTIDILTEAKPLMWDLILTLMLSDIIIIQNYLVQVVIIILCSILVRLWSRLCEVQQPAIGQGLVMWHVPRLVESD